MLLLILVILSINTMTGYALADDRDSNISANETIANPVSAPVDTIVIDDDAKLINITENSDEATVIETIIKEEQIKSSPGFWLTDTVMSLITAIIVIMAMVYIRKNR